MNESIPITTGANKPFMYFKEMAGCARGKVLYHPYNPVQWLLHLALALILIACGKVSCPVTQCNDYLNKTGGRFQLPESQQCKTCQDSEGD